MSKLRVLENNLNEVDTNLRALSIIVNENRVVLSSDLLVNLASVIESHDTAMNSLKDLIESNEVK
jgi:hypothetical protein